MKLPTLNVDLAVNTKNFKRDLENLQGATSKAIGADKAGKGVGASALNLLGGAAGLGAIGGPISAGFTAFKFALDGSEKVLMSFADSVANGKSAMAQFQATGTTAGTGIGIGAAQRLAAADTLASQFKDSATGWVDTFWGNALQDDGTMGGPIGAVTDAMHGLLAGTKAGIAGLGAALGDKGGSDIGSAMSETWNAAYAVPPTDAERLLALNTKILRENLS